MRLSIIVPVYNEKNTILELLRKVSAVPLDKEIIVVDDGSTDGTREMLEELRNADCGVRNELRIVLQDKNRGKGAAIRRGLEEVAGEVVVIQDADLEYEPLDFVSLIRPIEKGRADVVYGSRILGRGPKSSWLFYLGGRTLSWVANLLYGIHITDEPTCYKMFRSGVIKSLNLNCDGFEFCPEVTAKVSRRGFRITELPIHYYPRNMAEGKKIRLKDWFVAVWTLIRLRFY